jgi:tetratricopeptide (TPR) repeat protein
VFQKRLFTQLAFNWEEIPLEYYAHYTAVQYYLTVEDEPPQDAIPLDKIRRYLEAFYHLSGVEDWQRCLQICLVKLPTLTQQTLHNQLAGWGYYQQQVEIYQTTFKKLNCEWDTICLNGLGNFYNSVGNYQQAIQYQRNVTNKV